MAATSKQQILTYVVFVFLFSSFFYFQILHAGSLGAGGGIYVRGLMWCPALAAFATLALNRRSFRELGWAWRWSNRSLTCMAGQLRSRASGIVEHRSR